MKHKVESGLILFYQMLGNPTIILSCVVVQGLDAGNSMQHCCNHHADESRTIGAIQMCRHRREVCGEWGFSNAQLAWMQL